MVSQLSKAHRAQAQGADTILDGLESVREGMQYQRSLIEQLAARVGLSPAPRRGARPGRSANPHAGRPRARTPARAGRARPQSRGSPTAKDAAIVAPVFGFGITELIVVGLVILMLFSPRELPGMMKTLARVYGSIRRTAEEFRAQVMEAEELREPIEEIRAAYHGTKQELLTAQELARRELGRARAEAMKAQQKLTELHREETRREAAAITPAATPAATSAATPAVTHPLHDPRRRRRCHPRDQGPRQRQRTPRRRRSQTARPASSAPVPEASQSVTLASRTTCP
jgi:Sec-independent protein translocase protein TatA